MKNVNYDKLGYYKVLDVSPDSSEEAIRHKYKELAKFWHPDHNNDPKALDIFQKISTAYDILKDPKLRLKYTLLSIIYGESNFPDLNALSLIRNMHGQEDLNIRAFHLTEITGRGLTHKKVEKTYYCSQYEAPGVIKSIAKHNWLYGYWGITAFFANLRAIFKNISSINNNNDNLLLLLHNSLVYDDENKKEEAITTALLALQYAPGVAKPYINQYINSLRDYTPLSTKKWNFSKLIRIQLFYPFLFLFLIFVCFCLFFLNNIRASRQSDLSVKQVVLFNDGQKTFSDVAVARIFEIPVDIHDTKRLYHATEDTKAMYGADKSFDILRNVRKGLTVRITGYTANKKWFRVMFDDGEMGFIEADKLDKGIGDNIPLWSKIYRED